MTRTHCGTLAIVAHLALCLCAAGTGAAATILFSFQEGNLRRDGALVTAEYSTDCTYIRGNDPNTNKNADPRLLAGSNKPATTEAGPLRTLLEFNLSAIAAVAGLSDVTVTHVQLVMRATAGGAGTLLTTQAYEYEHDVVEDTCTWNAPGAGDAVPGGSHSNLLAQVYGKATDPADLVFPNSQSFRAAVSNALARPDHTLRLLLKHDGDNGSSTGQSFHSFVHDEDAAVESRPELIVQVSLEPDSDSDGLPDAWEGLHGGMSRFKAGRADFDRDRVYDAKEYTAGTDPADAASFFRLAASAVGGGLVSFNAPPAAGPGYEGYSRRFAVYCLSNLPGNAWSPVTGLTNIEATGQTVAVSIQADDSLGAFSRGLVWLEREPAAPPDPNPLAAADRFEFMDGLRITISARQLVGLSRPDESGWGYYQFPTISRLPDGRLLVTINNAVDSDTEMGRPGPAFASADEGASWTPYAEVPDLTIANSAISEVYSNEFLCVPVKPSLSTTGLTLPAIASSASVYGVVEFYRLSDFEEQAVRDYFAAPPALRWTPASQSWQTGTVAWQITDGMARKRPAEDILPRTYIDNRIVKAYGRLYYPDFKMNYLLPGGEAPSNYTCRCMASEDNGRSWAAIGLISYLPSTMTGEPCMELTTAGELACAIRTSTMAPAPLYMAYSSDEGHTWSALTQVNAFGVMPRLLRLGNNVMLLSFGRPDVTLKVSPSGNARDWSEAITILSSAWMVGTCGYTHMIATGPNQALLVYSDFNYYVAGTRYKAILVRRITAERG